MKDCNFAVDIFLQVTQRTTGELLDKRDIELIDQSGVIVNLTVWGDHAHAITRENEHQTIGVKGAWVREFNGWSC